MSTLPRSVLLTYDDLREMPDDRNRYELFEGELQVTPAPGLPHQRAAFRLAVQLTGYVDRHALGEIFMAPCDVVLSETNVIQPDVLFVARASRARLLDTHIKGPPDLAVEVVSPSTALRDQGAKLKLYAQYGVPNYWIVDPLKRAIRALALHEGEYREVAAARGEEPFSAPPFPELTFPLSELWR